MTGVEEPADREQRSAPPAPERRRVVRRRPGGHAAHLIAETPDDLTPEWFTEVLRAGGTIGADAGVTSVDVQQIGTGQLGAVTRAALEYDHTAAGPASLVIKLPSSDEGSRGMGVAMGVYRSEVRFYEQIAPLVDLRTPVLHWSALDEETGRFTLVLEDLSPRADAGDMLAWATAERTSLAIRSLVALQSPLWDDPRLRRKPWLANLGSMRRLFGAVPAAVGKFKQRFGDRIEAHHTALVETLAPRAPEIVDAVWKPPFVVGHGDYRLDNMLFGRAPSAPPLTVIDWQTTCLAPPGLDIAVFLGSSVDTETRRATEQGLLEEYVDELAEAGVRNFGRTDAWNSYRAASLSPFLLSVFTSVTLEQTERGDAMWTQLLRCSAELVSDTEAARLLQ
ncbi:phosphotransferase [Saccharothrix saharensis]|uniref:phosphotransferase n=1 Tax=Saccharothrix saharensis TaxID=571190 RepID=UPI00367FCFD4